jgi:hypothetical protein
MFVKSDNENESLAAKKQYQSLFWRLVLLMVVLKGLGTGPEGPWPTGLYVGTVAAMHSLPAQPAG